MRTFEQGLTAKIIGALCTRLTTTPAVMRRALHGEFREWAKIRILPNGDTIRAAAFGSDTGAVARDQADSRDATFVRVSIQCSPRQTYSILIHSVVRTTCGQKRKSSDSRAVV